MLRKGIEKLYIEYIYVKISILTYEKKIDRYVKNIWIYMNACYRYIWYEKQGKIYFVIQYQCNVSVNSPWIYINTESTFLGSSCSPTMTLTETTSDMICKSGMTADATSGREKYWKTLYRMHLCENIYLDIWKKLTDMSEISRKYHPHIWPYR